MIRQNKIKQYFIFIFLMITAGICLEIIIIWLAMVLQDKNLTIQSMQLLFSEYEKFYLLHLIPFFSGLSGVWITGKYNKYKDRLKSRSKYYSQTLDNIIEFANRIAGGNLNQSFISQNGEIRLREALESMRESLIDIKKRERERITIANSLGEINEILRPIDEINRLGDVVTHFMVNKIDQVVQGAFYTLIDDEDKI